jgi:hypothetical protein
VGIEKGVSFPITAVDAFSAMFAKLKGEVGQAQGSFASLKGYLATAFAGISIGGLTAMVHSTIEAMEHLDNLSKTAGISVESISGLSIAAKQSGTDIDGLSGVLNKLSVNMGKNADAFNALGISTKDPLKALEMLSDRFVGLEDPAAAQCRDGDRAGKIMGYGGAAAGVGQHQDRGNGGARAQSSPALLPPWRSRRMSSMTSGSC